MVHNNNLVVKKIADYILLNAYSVNGSGFYNGKAGLSLALFEVAHLLNDESLEEHAFELIQEALVTGEKSSFSFENGLSGIGYVLRYLVNNHFIDADFKDIFGKEDQTLRNSVFNGCGVKTKGAIPITIGYFLNDRENVQLLIEQTYQSLHDQFSMPFLSSPVVVKYNLFKQYETLLKVVCSCIEPLNCYTLLHQYSELYRRGLADSNYVIGYYMQQLSQSRCYEDIMIISKEMMRRALVNCRPELLSLSLCIDWLYLLRKDERFYQREIETLERKIIIPQEQELESSLIQMISSSGLMCGYESGVSRWVLYIVFRTLSLRGEDVSRFDGLFK